MLTRDLDYARSLAGESRVPIPMSATAHEMFVAAQAAGHGGKSQPALFELWRSLLDARRGV
jgi:3-hydroxyisobutyrate dehydrogenase-like beta-hydroxyacid dehydrogenase